MSAKANKARHKVWEAEQIAKASLFTSVMWRGWPEGHDRREASSLEEARALRDAMITEYGITNFGRRPIIYAVTPDNVTVLVE